MQCALDYYKKRNKCYACGARTDGIFTPAEKLLRKLKAKQERRREEKDKFDKVGGSGIEIGGGSDDEEGGEGAPSDGDDDE
jgi:RING finger protein 113A